MGVHYGVGRHNADLTIKTGESALQVWWISELFYIMSTSCLRLAAGTFLLRFAQRKWHRSLLYTCLAVNIVFNLYYFITSFFQCAPLPFFWTQIDPESRGLCHIQWGTVNTYVAIGLMAAIDYVFGLLPFCILWELNINRKRKVLVGLILSLVCVAGTATLLRLPYVYTLAHTSDFLYFTVDLAIWSYIEPGLGLIALSLITLGPLFRSLLNARGSGSGSSSFSQPAKPPSNMPKQHWKANDAEYQLRGIPKHMGNTSIVEGGLSRSNSDEKQQWMRSLDDHRRGSKIMKLSLSRSQAEGRYITKTLDVTRWSHYGKMHDLEDMRISVSSATQITQVFIGR